MLTSLLLTPLANLTKNPKCLLICRLDQPRAVTAPYTLGHTLLIDRWLARAFQWGSYFN